MAKILSFPFAKAVDEQTIPGARTYNLEITAYPDECIEFKADGVRTDPRSLYKIAADLEKIASIICSDVITDAV